MQYPGHSMRWKSYFSTKMQSSYSTAPSDRAPSAVDVFNNCNHKMFKHHIQGEIFRKKFVSFFCLNTLLTIQCITHQHTHTSTHTHIYIYIYIYVERERERKRERETETERNPREWLCPSVCKCACLYVCVCVCVSVRRSMGVTEALTDEYISIYTCV